MTHDDLGALLERINDSISETESLLARMKTLRVTVLNEMQRPKQLDAAFRAILAINHARFEDPQGNADEPTPEDQWEIDERKLGEELTVRTEP